MKTLLLIGGILGFGIGLGFSWARESAWPTSFWHACVCAYIAGFLMKWWGRAWQKNLEQALHQAQGIASEGNAPGLSTLKKS